MPAAMEKAAPRFAMFDRPAGLSKTRSTRSWLFFLTLVVLLSISVFQWTVQSVFRGQRVPRVPLHASQILDKCRSLSIKPGPPPDFNSRTTSDRFVPGTKSTLIRNATVWTGGASGHEVIHGDIFLDGGIIKFLGDLMNARLNLPQSIEVVEANGAWVSPGIVDMHSHLAVDSSPALRGAADGNSRKGPVLPWLRALDGVNTHDDAYRLSISGGITTALVLPGSANAIGGQGVVIKLRPTAERSPTSMLLENPYSTNVTEYDPSISFRYRQMKHACGENPDRVYANTRMDTAWAFRQAYEKARQMKEEQDEYCSQALAGQWGGLPRKFPEDLQWEALVDVLRGRVKVHNHCYETVDLDDMVRITNEFKFSIAAFHHAHETYLVPNTLKAAYGGPPAAALFATNARYKRESYRGSEFAPKILAENGIPVVMKSDHPVLNSRFLLYEAQQAHYYGLSHNLALLSVTGTPANIIGMNHRVGFIKPGFDADIVLWDSHPLALGATPKQVWIDGIAQIAHPHVNEKPATKQRVPITPNFDQEAEATLKHDGLLPLEPKESIKTLVAFTNVSGIITRKGNQLEELVLATNEEVVIDRGRIICSGTMIACQDFVQSPSARIIDLEGGWVAPSLISVGSPLGLEEIAGEASTSDGLVLDLLKDEIPDILKHSNSIIHAVDGLQYSTRNARLAYRSGVSVGVVAPKSSGLISGLSTAFSTAPSPGGFYQDIAALHVNVGHSTSLPSVSTQIAALRNLFEGSVGGELGAWFEKAANGTIPLVIHVDSADVMIALLRFKTQYNSMKMVFAGAEEAHLLAQALASAEIGVILAPSRPYPHAWENRRILPGPPLSEESAISLLLAHNVTVGLGVTGAWEARNARFDAAWAGLEAGGKISRKEVYSLVSTNLERLLGLDCNEFNSDLVGTKGGDLLDFDGKVVAIISPGRGVVDLF